MENHTVKGIKEALLYLETGNTLKTQKIIGTLFEGELGCPELMYTTLCCTYWNDTIYSLNHIENPYERGERLLAEWKSFLDYMARRAEKEYKPALFAIQKGIFTIALENYLSMIESSSGQQKSELYRKAGLCYKKLGSFENACMCLIEANNIQGGQASVLAELADCYSLCGNDRTAKVLFREAFFIAPEAVDLEFLDSGLIHSLTDKLSEKKFPKRALQEWIPVYGVLWGIFNVKRELNSQEVGKLKQDIYAMENEYKNPSCDTEILIPRLLKSYFWLIDQYVLTSGSKTQIDEVLLKIKILDSSIYELYVK